jgi:hypothetical protein
MELALALIAVVVAAVSLGMVLQLRGQLARALEAASSATHAADQARVAATSLERALTDTGQQFERLRAELAEVRATLENPPPPPLPKAHPRQGLDELREQLRAAAREPSQEDEES